MTPLLPPPRSDYELFPGIGYYKFHDVIQIWPRAREICAEEGAHLAVINSEAEAEVMKKLFAKFPTISGATHNDWAWVGLYEQEGSPGLYKTVFGMYRVHLKYVFCHFMILYNFITYKILQLKKL